MPQLKLSVAAEDADAARTLVGLLSEAAEPAPIAVSQFEAGAGRFLVEAYFEAEATLGSVVALVEASGACAGAVSQAVVADENWVALSQAALPPVIAGRFIVHGSHDAARVGRRPGAILIDAGEAFGTAHHATTHGCLLALERVARSGPFPRILDLGCGSGVLAIAAARLFPQSQISASDVDPIAVDVAAANARRNGVVARVRPVVAVGFDHARLRGPARFDLIVANILAGPLIALATSMRGALPPGGICILSGLLVPQAAAVLASYRAVGFHLIAKTTAAGWAVLVLARR